MTAKSRLTAHPQLFLESATVAENLVHFSIVFCVLWKNTFVYLLPGLSKYNIQTRFLTSKGIYIRVFGFSFAWKATYIRVFFLMLSRVKKIQKIQKNTLKIHLRHSISINKNTRTHVKIHTRFVIRMGKYIRIFYFSLGFSEYTYVFCHIPC